MSDLTARLAERIDWLHARTPWIGARAYLAALREIVGLHYPDPEMPGWCVLCRTADGDWPCATVRTVCEAVGVDWDSDCRGLLRAQSGVQPEVRQ